ncbi:MAG: redox-sensitive bicupin YhaK (pirin superfamily) [Rubritalea sp.]|jgi:redox-sensitive bicupin YhaK (pirin superfamily)
MEIKPAFTIRRSDERGTADHGWLLAKHSFSFAQYFNSDHMSFRSLRVINQDRIAAGGGFPNHPHENMEIFSYVLSGALSHEDSMGNNRKLTPGMIQLMSAGSGVTHSEFNPSPTDSTQLLQIWIRPNKQNLTPSYTEWEPNEEQRKLSKALIISEDGRGQSATIHQDVSIYKLQLKADESISHELATGRGMWIQMIKGTITINEHTLQAGDAISSEEAGHLTITSLESTEALLFDLK